MRDADTMSPKVVSEVECHTCGTLAINRDFCTCGEYLGWELTLAPEAEAGAAAPPLHPRPSCRPPRPRRAPRRC